MTPLDPQISDVLDAMAAEPEPDEPPTLEEVRAGARARVIERSAPRR